ncbi:MAG TPA: SgcJ/EcaC family oxidoreductase [Micromonosporaceae bacterium]
MPATEDAARDLYAQLLAAWNRRDADAYATLFTDDGVVIGFDGSQMHGSGEVREQLRTIFADHPTATYVAKVRTVRALGTQAVLLRAIAGMTPPGGSELNPAVNAVQCLVAERQADGWRIALFQNTPAQYHGRPGLVAQHTAELAELPPGQTVGG